MIKIKPFLILFLILHTYSFSQQRSNFIKIKNNTFYNQNKPFFPIVINYIVDIQRINGKYWVAPEHGYGNTNFQEGRDSTNARLFIKNDFLFLKEFGFNTVRIIGISPGYNKENKFGFNAFPAPQFIEIENENNYQKYIKCIKELISIAEEVNIRLILLYKAPLENQIENENIFKRFLSEFKNDPIILAYDFANEPLYESNRNKIEAYTIVNNWYKILKEIDTNHLVTIGFANSSEISGWDPNILQIDFASFHPYGSYETVMNEIFYYSKYIEKPWIIGETGLPADDSIVLYSIQEEFADKIIRQSIGCNAKGFSWWQYQDVHWGKFKSNYYGLLSNNGNYTINNISIQGTPKPALYKFSLFNSNLECDCSQLNNFYNYNNYTKFKLVGTINDSQSRNLIAGALIQGWYVYEDNDSNKIYTYPVKTFSKNDGTFELYSNQIINHLSISAPKYNTQSFKVSNDLLVKDTIINKGNTFEKNNMYKILIRNVKISNGATFRSNSGYSIDIDFDFEADYGSEVFLESNYFDNIGYTIENNIQLIPFSIKKYSIENSHEIKTNNETIFCYPNPINDILNVNSSETILNIYIYSISGKKIFYSQYNEKFITLNLTNNLPGIYILYIITQNSIYKTKIIKY